MASARTADARSAGSGRRRSRSAATRPTARIISTVCGHERRRNPVQGRPPGHPPDPGRDGARDGHHQGARAFGLADQLGSIEAGKKADLVLFDTHRPEWQALFNPVNNLVYNADGRSVHTVIVDGRIVVEDYRQTFVDEDRSVRPGPGDRRAPPGTHRHHIPSEPLAHRLRRGPTSRLAASEGAPRPRRGRGGPGGDCRAGHDRPLARFARSKLDVCEAGRTDRIAVLSLGRLLADATRIPRRCHPRLPSGASQYAPFGPGSNARPVAPA